MIRGNPETEVGKPAPIGCRAAVRPKTLARWRRLGPLGVTFLTLLMGFSETASARCARNTPRYCRCNGRDDVANPELITRHLRDVLLEKKSCVARRVGAQFQNPAVSRMLDQAIDAATRLFSPDPSLSCNQVPRFIEDKEEILENIGAQVLQRAVHVETLFGTFKEKVSRTVPNDPEKFLVVPDPNLPFKINKAKKFFKKLPQSRGGGLSDFTGTPETIPRQWLAEQLERKVLTYIAGSEYIDRVYGQLSPNPSARPCTYPPVLGLYQGFAPNLLNLFNVDPAVNGGCPAPGAKAAILRAYPGWEQCHVLNPFNAANNSRNGRIGRLKGPNGEYTDEKYSRVGRNGLFLSHLPNCQGSGNLGNHQFSPEAIERGADLQEAANYIINGYFVELHFVLLDTFKKEILEKGRIPSPEIFDGINSHFGIDKANIEAARTNLREQYADLATHAKQNLSAPGVLDCDDLETGYDGRNIRGSGSAPSTSNGAVDTQQTGLRSNQIRVCLLQAAQVELESASALKLATSSYLQASFRLQEFLESSGATQPEDVRSCN